MKAAPKKPCNQCPFRKCSIPGYLGESTPSNFIQTTLGDAEMPCHQTVDYERPDWKTQLEDGGTARQCAGAAVFFANILKLSRDLLSSRKYGHASKAAVAETRWPGSDTTGPTWACGLEDEGHARDGLYAFHIRLFRELEIWVMPNCPGCSAVILEALSDYAKQLNAKTKEGP